MTNPFTTAASPAHRLAALAAGLRLVDTPGVVVLAAACPILFLHVSYQPSLTVRAAGTHVGIALQDVAVLLVVATALAEGARSGVRPPRGGGWIWASVLALLAWIVVSAVHARATEPQYAFARHLVTAGKFAEYALLAATVPLLVRTRRDLGAVLAAVTGWICIASVVGLAQFFGAHFFAAWGAGRRNPSFLGVSDFAAIAGAVLLAGLAELGLTARLFPRRWHAVVAVAAGGVGFVLAAASAGVLGLGLAAVVAAAYGWRHGVLSRARVLLLAATMALAAGGVFAIRGKDYDQFLRFLGVEKAQRATSQNVQTYIQRTLLLYIGARIFLDHPGFGVGWQDSAEANAYLPYLAAAHRRFPHTAAQAFPARGRSYGIQNAYLQAAAEMGAAGGILFALVLLVPLATALRQSLSRGGAATSTGLLADLLLSFALGLWTAEGIVAGIPLAALTWLAIGLAAAARSASGEQPPATGSEPGRRAVGITRR